MSDRTWPSLTALKRFWPWGQASLSGKDPRTEGAFDAVAEDVVEAIGAAAGERLLAGHEALRSLYSEVSATAEDGGTALEQHPAFTLGRLVGLLDVVSDAVRRSFVGGVDAALENVSSERLSLQVLETLQARNGALINFGDLRKAVASRFGRTIDQGTLSRTVGGLDRRRLVSTRRVGRTLLVRPTRLGIDVARRYTELTRQPDDLLRRVGAYRDAEREVDRLRAATA